MVTLFQQLAYITSPTHVNKQRTSMVILRNSIAPLYLESIIEIVRTCYWLFTDFHLNLKAMGYPLPGSARARIALASIVMVNIAMASIARASIAIASIALASIASANAAMTSIIRASIAIASVAMPSIAMESCPCLRLARLCLYQACLPGLLACSPA